MTIDDLTEECPACHGSCVSRVKPLDENGEPADCPVCIPPGGDVARGKVLTTTGRDLLNFISTWGRQS